MKRLIRVVGIILSGDKTKALVELELVNVSGKVSDISHIGSHVVLGTGIKLFLISWHRWNDTLNVHPELVPVAVELALISPATVHVPTILVDQIAEGHEDQLGQGHVEHDVDVGLIVCDIDIIGEQS